MIFEVRRFGKCIECQQDSNIFIAQIEANTEQEAIDKAISEWIYDHYGDAGSLREDEIIEEDKFFNADFKAEIVKDAYNIKD